MRLAAKVDTTQAAIVSALTKAGATVQSLAPIGRGCPDLLAAYGGQMYLLECKSGKAKPNEMQKRWHAAWGTPVYVVREPEEALRAVGVLV